MPDNITVTGQTGPGLTVTSLVFNNIRELNFQIARSVLEIVYDDPVGNTKTTHFDLYTIVTVTYTISTHVATVTVST